MPFQNSVKAIKEYGAPKIKPSIARLVIAKNPLKVRSFSHQRVRGTAQTGSALYLAAVDRPARRAQNTKRFLEKWFSESRAKAVVVRHASAIRVSTPTIYELRVTSGERITIKAASHGVYVVLSVFDLPGFFLLGA